MCDRLFEKRDIYKEITFECKEIITFWAESQDPAFSPKKSLRLHYFLEYDLRFTQSEGLSPDRTSVLSVGIMSVLSNCYEK